MPLRAKITNPEMRNQRSYASSSGPAIDSLPGDPENDVVFGSKYGVRTIQLNRPDKLNSLNGSMARKIIPRLQEWSKSGLANVVVIKGAGRAFCAGGDVAVLAQDCAKGVEGQQQSKDYFALEYKLDHLIATYNKPYVAFIDGITMGGGVGLSVHAPFRIATERTVFAMPETTIGFFPDVGASFFLPRMDGALGLYLALTSERLKGPEVFFSGIATHYIHSSSLPDLEARLAELRFKDYSEPGDNYEIINNTIEEFTTGLPHDQPLQMDKNIRKIIDYAFQHAHDTPTKILSALEQTLQQNVDDYVKEWAKKTISTIRERSPISVAVSLQQYRKGAEWDIAQTFQQEYQIASKFMEHPDFVTGVTARLISKQKGRPDWKPNQLEDVTKEEVQEFFSGNDSELKLLNTEEGEQYMDYPHAWLGLPREQSVLESIRNNDATTRDNAVAFWLEQTQHKMGTKEKVLDILDRKTRTDEDGNLELIGA
ncbi:3-hydroxyisobutyryl-CoA hydrolase mitochondrial precursor [Myriangium duriaei CBS 260.36]|uniref:3-hydroxyisobutyryl-CoA hydrolase n=1 Tax=Myriangium duriaei CBS 260.36 TaxID=1168546 RepID=A0A9P4MFF6_9PEZI|nr:3-hydroxyisobutyryl-CoA hydrolase mitochondrial precursor [Myriangium duriaei CBS 260.36]